MAYFFSLAFERVVFAAGFRAAAFGALAAGAVVAAGSRAGAAAARDGRVAGGRAAPFVSSLTPIVRWLVRCLMKKARPMARGCTRFIDGPPSAMACTTRKSSRLRSW